MFDNIGEKIQNLAQIVTIVGIVASIISGILFMAGEMFFVGIVTAILGSLSSWVGSFVLYGFGKLICDTNVVAHNSYALYTLLQSNSAENK